MITANELEPFLDHWKDVSIIRVPDDYFGFPAYVIILIFSEKTIGQRFLDLLAENDFGLGAHNKNGSYFFEIGFPEDEIGLYRPTDTPIGHYQLNEWLREGNTFLIT